MAKVPPVDLPTESEGSRRFVDLELRLLDADAKAKENLNREADQRYFLRWGAVALSVAVVAGMAFMLYHVGYYMLSKSVANVPAAFLVAIYVAPIVSMTTVSLALLVAAFRAFKDGDEKAGASLMTEGAKATGLIN
ncbi:hypothetical protein [Sphingobium sp. ZW T5_29]|uniref:hypothetical protein n=1 Tax=Sphingobium sp. ZW T5_29 TaxID=3378077 RepID=UPI0038539BDF